MAFRIATFNVENLMNRFDLSGFRNQLQQDRALSLYQIRDEAEFRALEQARAVASTDDTRQLTALAIAATRADILCLQEIDNIEALRAFEYGYLYRMIGQGYRQKFTVNGNDTRGIDVALAARETTADGVPIEFVRMTSHAHITFGDFDLHNERLRALGIEANERIFRRDCLEIDLRIGVKPLTVYCVHFKSMGSPRDGVPGREVTMPIRHAEASAVRRIIEERFGREHAGDKAWLICGDLNDYRERIPITGEGARDIDFSLYTEPESGLAPLFEGGFCENLVERLPPMERWTLYHTRGPEERHLCQLDYILASPLIARRNPAVLPDIVRRGQPWRTLFPPGQEVDRYPRTGWDRPKASDHCPVAVTLHL